jgi:hypothetical protein
VPNWLSDRLGLNVGFTVLFTIALIADALVETMFEGVAAAWPGSTGTPTALPYIAQSRGLFLGYQQSDADAATFLQGWLDIWKYAGAPFMLAQLVQTYLGNNLVVRVVERRTGATRFTTIDENNDVSFVDDDTWDWDETQYPARAAFWSDLWIIVYLTDGRWPHYTTLGDSEFLTTWGTYGNVGCGFQIPQTVSNDLKSLASIFKGAHTYVRAFIFTTDDTIFVPESLGGAYPNGYWADWSRNLADVQTPSRSHTSPGGKIRYIIPNKGG